ncbi:lycopene cyclase domain-containing protein [Arthrobacter wenxiniae]|uniref:Lycopene cyclase domain-containing protein n=1 Tax=Arthrobacter wenxiniae TaxID=2713570 RepID=A0A7Y7LYQ8_9MICC|nr:lycopene cyclase domain-containing protein [Arthrobacter wenxiniae]
MNYAQLNALFLVPALAVLLAALARRRGKPRLGLPARGTPGRGTSRPVAGVAATLVVLVVLTGVFDNLMIGSGLFGYAGHALAGARVGLAPVEDFAYPAAAALLLPGLWLLFTRERPK